MKLFCWNINSVAPTVRNCVLKYGSYKGLFDEHDADIVCLQETKAREDKLTKEICCVEGYQSFWAISLERKGYSGVATYACTSFAPLSCETDCLGAGEGGTDREGRVVITDHGALVVVNVYVPNAGDRPQRARLGAKIAFLQALKAKCDSLVAQGREVVILGDFNVAAAPQDVHPALGYDGLYTPEEREAMLALLRDYTDVWRRLHPDTTDVYSVWDEYTGARAFNKGLRIDYFLVTPGLLGRVVSCEMVPTLPKWSDHTGMLLELRDIPAVPPHPPCPQWTKLLRRFTDTSQPSIVSLFGRKKPATAAGAAGAPKAAAAAAAPRAELPAAADAAAGSAAAAPAPSSQRDAGCRERDGHAAAGAEGSAQAAQAAPAQQRAGRSGGGKQVAGRQGPSGAQQSGETAAGGGRQQQQRQQQQAAEGREGGALPGSSEGEKGGLDAGAASAGAPQQGEQADAGTAQQEEQAGADTAQQEQQAAAGTAQQEQQAAATGAPASNGAQARISSRAGGGSGRKRKAEELPAQAAQARGGKGGKTKGGQRGIAAFFKPSSSE